MSSARRDITVRARRFQREHWEANGQIVDIGRRIGRNTGAVIDHHDLLRAGVNVARGVVPDIRGLGRVIVARDTAPDRAAVVINFDDVRLALDQRNLAAAVARSAAVRLVCTVVADRDVVVYAARAYVVADGTVCTRPAVSYIIVVSAEEAQRDAIAWSDIEIIGVIPRPDIGDRRSGRDRQSRIRHPLHLRVGSP